MEKPVNTNGTIYCGPCTNGCNTDVFMLQKISLVLSPAIKALENKRQVVYDPLAICLTELYLELNCT